MCGEGVRGEGEVGSVPPFGLIPRLDHCTCLVELWPSLQPHHHHHVAHSVPGISAARRRPRWARLLLLLLLLRLLLLLLLLRLLLLRRRRTWLLRCTSQVIERI